MEERNRPTGFIKPSFSWKTLGKKTVWHGCFLWVAVSIVLGLFFCSLRESVWSMMNLLHGKSLMPCSKVWIYNLFYAAFSTVLGFCAATFVWMSGSRKKVRKNHLRKLAMVNAAATFCIALFVWSKLYFTVFSVIFPRDGGQEFNKLILQDYRFLLFLIPVCIFLSQWNMIRLVFRIRWWFLPVLATSLLLTSAVCILCSFF